MRPTLRYAELHTHSCFSFLRGASHPEDLVARAKAESFFALALTDHDAVYAAPRFHAACREQSLPAIHGADVTLEGNQRLVLLVRDLAGWKNLCRLLTRGRRRSAKGHSAVTFADVAAHAPGLIALSGGREGAIESALLRGDEAEARALAGRYLDVFGRRGFYLEQHHHLLAEEARLRGLQARLARQLGLGCVATNHVHYAEPSLRALQDVLTCIREKTSLDRAGRRLLPNGEFYLKAPAAMAALWRDFPQAVRTTIDIADRCRFSLDELRYELPSFPVEEGETPFSCLHRLANEGARRRYRPLTPKVARQLAHEMDVIERLGFAGYFLIVWDIVRFCGERGILCQGRGSAANSAVCYALGITSVDPIGLDLLFERFLSDERKEAPDIDLDIEHERREEVLQYVYERYGREHAGMVCTFITYRARSAVRDVGKALGLSEAQVRTATKVLDWQSTRQLAGELEGGTVSLPGIRLQDGRLRHLADLCRRMDGFPRHLSIHTGGMVISASPLHEVVPIENATMPGRTVIQWDKDDVGALGLVKIDLLGLGALALLHRALELLAEHKGVRLDLARLAPDDAAVYDMMCRADTVGVFQIESRAQMNCLPRLKPRCFYDLVIEVALIRPGPIQGKMVHPFLRRRAGREAVTYPHPSLKPILARTLGVPLFQEQGMKIAVAAAGFSASEADELRRAMGHRRSRERMAAMARRLVDGMAARGIDKASAERIFTQLAAFADFGFAESHAASFALIVYATAYLKHHHPEVYVAAILNAQPMGFYSPATLINDARRHGVAFRPIDVQASEYDCTLEREEGEEREGERGGQGGQEERSDGNGGGGGSGGKRCARSGVSRGSDGNGEGTGEASGEGNGAAGGGGPKGGPGGEAGNGEHLAVRLGLRFVNGIGEEVQEKILSQRRRGAFRSAEDFGRRCGLPARILERLASLGAFACFGLKRREALWQIQALAREVPGPLAAPRPAEAPVALPEMSVAEELVAEYRHAGLSASRQPLELWRRQLRAAGVKTASELEAMPEGLRVAVGGLVICRQRPPTAKGMCFLTLEDETGLINVMVTPQLYEQNRRVVRMAPFLMVRGRVERADGVLNVRGEQFQDLQAGEAAGRFESHDFH